ncbi:response regulator transcription factor [Spiribacter insolitus]|uniref:Response regulator transcription factor n=1 Tax=Spiribacter insolitus TaxID=3122417 RepID=A0ABV3T752_9GAMM
MRRELAIVEDDATLREELAYLFEEAGYQVHQALNLDGLLDVLRLHPVRMLILDLNLPGVSGYEIAQQLRETHPGIGIIMLTARSRTEDRVKGYGAGADIYLTKPADPLELTAAVASLSRRVLGERNTHDLSLDCLQGMLRAPDQPAVELTPAETFILRALALAPDATLDSGELMDLLEEKFPDRSATRRSLENSISRLRGKAAGLLPDGVNLIRSVRGIGYQLGLPIQLVD